MNKLELKIPPVAVCLVCAALLWPLAQLPAPPMLPPVARLSLIAVILIFGVIAGFTGIAAFIKAKTTVDPTRPDKANALVDSGIYAISRNPMYLGLALLLAALAVWTNNPWTLLTVPAFVLYMNRFQIKPEERHLAEKFGDDYQTYRNKVRRWI